MTCLIRYPDCLFCAWAWLCVSTLADVLWFVTAFAVGWFRSVALHSRSQQLGRFSRALRAVVWRQTGFVPVGFYGI
jgi:hypothetical protein